jgi:hypothetical protein
VDGPEFLGRIAIRHRLTPQRALLTCKAENVASRRVIESNGGVPDSRLGQTLYYHGLPTWP